MKKVLLSVLACGYLIGSTNNCSSFKDSLEKYDFADISVNGDTTYLLTTIDDSSGDYFADPDGTKFVLKTLYLGSIDSNAKMIFQNIGNAYINPYNGEPGESLKQITILQSGNNIKFFSNLKTSSGTYAMDGVFLKYSINSDGSFKKVSGKNVFQNANWGWYPKLNSSNDDVEHFSFAGYYRYINSTNQGSITPTAMYNEFTEYQSKKSDGIMPNNKSTIIEKLYDKHCSSNTDTSSDDSFPSLPTDTTSNDGCYSPTSQSISSLDSGWHLLGTGKNVSDIKNIFGVKAVFVYDSESSKWVVNPNTITAGQGFWIKKWD